MTDAVITDVDQLDVAWFDDVLTRSGALRAGGVGGFETQPAAADNARMVAIRLRYRPDSTGALPTRLLLKLCGDGGAFGPSEVDYYARDYVDLPDAPIPRSYDARYSPAHRRYHILMDDLSATHRNNWQTVPSAAYGQSVAEALAALHAHHWGESRLGAINAAIPDEAAIGRYLTHVEPGLEPILASADGGIDGRWAATLRRIFARHPPALVARTAHCDGFTLVHGDVNPGNVLSPLAGTAPTYLIDRQPFDWSLTTWLGVADVAYLMVHWWDTDLRRRLEVPVLRRYHDELLRRGVTGYPWQRVVDDYKLCAVQSIYVAVRWCVAEDNGEAMKWVWLPQLKRSMVAFFDLGCDEHWG